MNRVNAYAAVTNARAEYIRQYIRDNTQPEEPDTDQEYDEPPEDYETDSYEPEEDTPLPAAKTAKTVELNSEEEAEEYLQEKLTDMDKIAFNESLECIGQTDIDGAECWEFSSQFNFSETGRYAVSSSGKIYEHDGNNYVSVK